MTTSYSVLVKAMLDVSGIQEQLKGKTYKFNMQLDADKLKSELNKIDNQLERLKIGNKDAFKSEAVKSQLSVVEQLRNRLELTGKGLDSYKDAYGKLNNEVLRYNNAVRTTIQSTDNFVSSMGKAITKIALWGIATGALYGSLKKIREGVQYIKDLNEEMTNIGLVSGQTTDQLSGTALEFNDKAKELGVTTLDVAKGYTEWARQGLNASDSMTLLTNSTKLATLGDLDAADATTKLTAAINAYGVSVEDSINIVDVLVRLDQEFATSTAEIASGMEKSSSMARQAGVSYQDLASYITVVSSITRQSGETIGQAFKTIFARLEQVKAGATIDSETGESINNVEKVLLKQGIALRDSNEQFRDMSDVLADVAVKYQELGAQGRDVEQAQILGAIAGKQKNARTYGNIWAMREFCHLTNL